MQTSQHSISAVLPDTQPSVIREILLFTRMHQWHPGKVPPLLGFVLSLYLAVPLPHRDISWTVTAYVLCCLYLGIGYMLNNLADQIQDSVVQKKIGLEGRSTRLKWALVLCCVLLASVIGITVMPFAAVVAMGACYLLAWGYSFPPRLKEGVVLGPFVAAFAQLSAPACTLAIAWGSLPTPSKAYLAVLFLYGMRMIMVHQFMDHDNDVATGIRTTSTVLGIAMTRKLIQMIFALELVATLILVILLLGAGLHAGLLVLFLWSIFVLVIYLRRGGRLQLDSYRYIPLADLHESLIPIIIAASLIMRDGVAQIGNMLLLLVLFGRRHFERLVLPLLGESTR